MIVKNRMTKNPICIDIECKINQAVDLMSQHGLHRLPVTRNGKLAGLITEGQIARKGPSKATSLDIYELNYLLSKTSVDAIMIKDVVTIQEDQLLEDAALLMQKHDIGCLPVVNDGNDVVGILTQNDVFAAFLDLLGYRDCGSRVTVEVKDKMGAIGELSDVFVRNNCNITHIGVYKLENGMADIIFRIDSFNTEALEKDLTDSGYKVLSISKNPN